MNQGMPETWISQGVTFINFKTMLIEKTGFLTRLRTVLTVFVMLIGLGSTLMAMKPADKNAAFTYGVAETVDHLNYRVIQNVTNPSSAPWLCTENPAQVCTVASDMVAPDNSLIPKSQATPIDEGEFKLTAD